MGNYCAVGYLIAQTAGSQVSKKLDQMYHNAYVMDEMKSDPIVNSWA